MAFHPEEIEILSQLRGERVLELGCGAGYTVEALAKIFNYIIGVDPDFPTMVSDKARENYRAPGKFVPVCARGEGLPFSNESFDGVVSHWSMHHYRYPLAVLREAYRVLRVGGWLYVADGVEYSGNDISPRQLNHILFHRAIIYAERKLGREHFPIRKMDDIIEIVSLAGYLVTEHKVVRKELMTDDEFSQSYIERIGTAIKLVEESAIAGEVRESLETVLGRIKKFGITLSPFAVILATKN